MSKKLPFVIIQIFAHGEDLPGKDLSKSETESILKMSVAGESGEYGWLSSDSIKRSNLLIETYLKDPKQKFTNAPGLPTEYRVKEGFEQIRIMLREDTKFQALLPSLAAHDNRAKGTHPIKDHQYHFIFNADWEKHVGKVNTGVFLVCDSEGYKGKFNRDITRDLGITMGWDGRKGDTVKMSKLVADVKRLFNCEYVGILDFSCRALAPGLSTPNFKTQSILDIPHNPPVRRPLGGGYRRKSLKRTNRKLSRRFSRRRPKEVRVPFMITVSMRNELKDMGYTHDDFQKMPTDIAHDIITLRSLGGRRDEEIRALSPQIVKSILNINANK